MKNKPVDLTICPIKNRKCEYFHTLIERHWAGGWEQGWNCKLIESSGLGFDGKCPLDNIARNPKQSPDASKEVPDER